jgi:hypothetical protein
MDSMELELSNIVNTSCTLRQNLPLRHSDRKAMNLYEYETLRGVYPEGSKDSGCLLN